MNHNENPYSPPSSVGSHDLSAGPAVSYTWEFAVAATVGLLLCGVFVMGPERFTNDVINSPLEFLGLVSGAMVIGLTIGWLTRDRRPATNLGVAKSVRFVSGFSMGVLPPFFQDLLDWMARSSAVLMTARLSFIRFLATIVLAVIAAIILERVLRLILVRRPDMATRPSEPRDSEEED